MKKIMTSFGLLRMSAVLITCIVYMQSHAQIITTVVGNGILGYTGDGGPATAAEIYSSGYLSFDGLGNMYIFPLPAYDSGIGNYFLRKINSAGIISTVAGNGIKGPGTGDGGPATAATFNQIDGIAVDIHGNIFLCDNWDYTVRKINAAGIVSTYAGVIDSYRYNGDGIQATTARFNQPMGIALDAAGNLYIADMGHSRIRKVDTFGIITTVAGNGTFGFSGDGGPATAAQLYLPTAVKIDAAGNLFIADVSAGDTALRIRKVNTSGIISTVAGNGLEGYSGNGGPATAAEFCGTGLAVDNCDNIFILEPCFNIFHTPSTRIQRVDGATGIITVYAGDVGFGYSGDGGPATAARIGGPTDAVVDACGNLYFTDGGLGAVRMINNTPPIMGASTICIGSTTFLLDAGVCNVPFGWKSSDTTIATVDSATGFVTGISTGTVTISYITSCFTSTFSLTVNTLTYHSTITGTKSVCESATTTLIDTLAGGTWSSSSPGIATVGTGSGVVTGVAAGSAYIIYTLPAGCMTTTTVTVHPLPEAITGPLTVCVGLTITLTDGPAGGIWSCSDTSIATIDSISGTVTGISSGTCTISYTNMCASATASLTVNSPVSSMTGTTDVCPGATTTLYDATAGGVWTSADLSIAAVDSTTGIVTGVATGTTTITYLVSAGCYATTTFTVNPPVPITGTALVCVGLSSTLSDATTGGVWSSSSSGVATVGSSGIFAGISAGICTITYSISSSGCYVTQSVTVNPLPSAIFTSDPTSICPGGTIAFADTSGSGTWSATPATVGTIASASGIFTGISGRSTATITYTLPTGCITTFPSVTVNANPSPIGGSTNVCLGASTTQSDATTGGVWSSSNTGIATIGSSGTVTGISIGAATITYLISSTGCFVTQPMSVLTVPASISTSGTIPFCAGSSISFTDMPAGGTWSVSSTTVGSIGSASGVFTGLSGPGAVTVTYTIPNGCFATYPSVSVNPTPLAITGPTTVCVGATITLADAVTGGTWMATTPAKGSVDVTTGIVTGRAVGRDTIEYTFFNGCGTATYAITVNPLPSAISHTGALPVCPGSSVTFTDPTTGGSWSLTPTTAGSITSVSGIFTGISGPATATVTYTLPTGCLTTFFPAGVKPAPGPISGPSSVCVGSAISLADAISGGTWMSTPTVHGTINASTGLFAGLSAGPDTIGYSFMNGCGTVTYRVTVNPLPALHRLTGGGAYCVGGPGVSVGLNGSDPGTNYQLYVGGTAAGSPFAGTGSPISFGLQTTAGTYTVVATNSATSCFVAMTGSAIVSINPLPNHYTVTGGGFYCSGAGAHVGLANSDTGILYQLDTNGVAARSPVAGTGSPLDFGLQTALGVYTVIATNAITGCSSAMTGSVAVSALNTVRVDETVPATFTGDVAYTYNTGSGGFTLAAVPLPSALTGVTYSWDDGARPVYGVNFSPTYTTGSVVAIHYYTISAIYLGCTVTTTIDVVVPPTGCSPYDYFGVNVYRAFDMLTPSTITCSGCGAVQPFHTITASVLNPVSGGNISANNNYYIVNNATLSSGLYTGDNLFMNGGVTLDLGFGRAYIQSCHFSASSNCMWNGINVYVDDTAAGSLIIDTSLVEYAGAGSTAGVNIINAPGASYYSSGMPNILTSIGTIYNSNYTGIAISGYQPSGAPVTPPSSAAPYTLPFTINDCLFTDRDLATDPPSGGSYSSYYPFHIPLIGTDIHMPPSSPDPADPGFDIDNYTVRVFTLSPAGQNGIYMSNTGYSDQISAGTTTTPAIYDYNYVQVGDTSADAYFTKTNLYDNMFFGVQLLNSNVLFNNNTFRHVNQGIMIGEQWNDVHIAGNQLTQLTSSPYYSGDNTNNRFYTNYQFGFSVQSVSTTGLFMLIPNDLTCKNALFTSSTYAGNHAIDIGLLTPAGSAPTYHNAHNISNNIIYNYGEGINIFHQTGSTAVARYQGTTFIDNNYIFAQPVTGGGSQETYTAISYGDQRVYTGAHGDGCVHIENNRIKGVENGIQFNSTVDSAFINTDTVVLSDYAAASTPPTGMVWGIYLNSSPFLTQVSHNIVGGWGYICGTLSYPTAGILTYYIGRASQDTVDLSCNAVHDLVRGFDFQGNNYVKWFNNEMVRDSFGMYLDGGGKIHQQGNSSTPSDNHWEGASGSCTYCASICSTPWPGWDPTSSIYRTYVSTSSDADSSVLWFRGDPSTYPSYELNGDNGSGSLAYPYGNYATLDSITSGLSAPSGCMSAVSFRTTSGAEPSGIVHKSASQVQGYDLYPNPSTGNLTITQSVKTEANVYIQIYNLLGQKVYESALQFTGGNASINVGNVAPGLYQVLLSDEKGSIWNKKIVIEQY